MWNIKEVETVLKYLSQTFYVSKETMKIRQIKRETADRSFKSPTDN